MTIFVYFFAIIGILTLPFVVVDFWMMATTWLSRIGIGRWKNREEWQKAIKRKAIAWLWHTPTTPITDENRLILWDMIMGRYKSQNIQSWQYAGLLMGLENDYSKEYLNAYDIYKSQEIDNALLIYVLWKKNAISQDILKSYVSRLIKNENQTVAYRKNLPHIRFVDTIGMLVPLLYASDHKELAQKQIEEYDKALLNNCFPAHAFNTQTCLPLGIPDWSRGLGWYILGITETKDLPGNNERIIKLANAIMSFIQSNGAIGCQYFGKSRQESSGTILVGILLINAYQISKNEKYLHAAEQIEKCLISITRRGGEIDYAQGDTQSIGMYSRKFDAMPFAQGMAMYFTKQLDDIITK